MGENADGHLFRETITGGPFKLSRNACLFPAVDRKNDSLFVDVMDSDKGAGHAQGVAVHIGSEPDQIFVKSVVMTSRRVCVSTHEPKNNCRQSLLDHTINPQDITPDNTRHANEIGPVQRRAMRPLRTKELHELLACGQRQKDVTSQSANMAPNCNRLCVPRALHDHGHARRHHHDRCNQI